MPYYLKDKHGRYLRRNISGDFTPVANIVLAESWTNEAKAKCVLENNLNKNLRGRYSIYYVEDEIVPKEVSSDESFEVAAKSIKVNAQLLKEMANADVDNGQTDKWVSCLDDMKVFIEGTEKRQEQLNTDLSKIDKEISDLNHYIEFGTFNASEGYLAFKTLKNKLVLRRKIKNELIVLSQIGNCNVTSEMIVSIQTAISNLDNLQYKPRVLKELFT